MLFSITSGGIYIISYVTYKSRKSGSGEDERGIGRGMCLTWTTKLLNYRLKTATCTTRYFRSTLILSPLRFFSHMIGACNQRTTNNL